MKRIFMAVLAAVMLISVMIPAAYAADEVTWKETNDTVYATTGVNVRKGPSTDFSVVGGIAKNSSVKRIAQGDNGWSKVKYGNGTYYVCSKYLTTYVESTGVGEVNRTVYATRNVNVRTGPSLDYLIADTISEGTELIEIMRYESGWSKVCYDGGTYYVFNKYLSTVRTQWTEVNEYVYAITDVNMRQSYSTDSKIVGTLKANKQVKRIAVGNNGWSKCSVNGSTVYIFSKYLTKTDPAKDVTMTPVNDLVYATTSVNVRSGPSLDCEVIGGLAKGKSVKRTAICDNGWCQVNINGQTAYVYGYYLTK